MGAWSPHAGGATSGDDTFTGNNTGETANGLAGDDTLNGNGGADTLIGGAGDDILNGGDGFDTASYANASGGVAVYLNIAGPQYVGGGQDSDTFISIEAVIGSDYQDVIFGNDVANTISGGKGEDTLTGNLGDDTINGGDSADTLYGDDGDSNLLEDGADTLSGGAGDDVLWGEGGDDTLDGGSGSDWAYYSGDSGIGVVVSLAITGPQHVGAEGYDTLISIENLRGTFYNDTLTGNGGANILEGGQSGAPGADILNGGGGNDTLYGGYDNDTLNGGAGNDTAEFFGGFYGAHVDLSISGAQDTGEEGMDTLISIENLIGSVYDDFLAGNTGANKLYGGDGDDVLMGRGGADTLDGGIYYGNDTASYAEAAAGVVASLTTGKGTAGEAKGDVFVSIESLTGSNFNDTLTGESHANTLTGNGGADKLSGVAGNDVLKGGDGADTLSGGTGHDKLTGGANADKFVFDVSPAAANSDTITDFTHGSDKIQLENSVFTALGAAGALAASAFYAGAHAHDANDRIIYDQSAGKLYYDNDGSGAHGQVLIATLTGHPTVTASDIVVI